MMRNGKVVIQNTQTSFCFCQICWFVENTTIV